MLERIRLKNFQCHDLLDVRFDDRITAIVGSSDVGKSSIIRALRWVAFNRPRGDSFVRDGEDRATVKVRVDGRTVERRRSKADNAYLLDGNPLRSFGTEVPEPVAELLNLGEENFKGQHDPPFWFALTPGEVAKRLNRIVDLGLIDESTACVAFRLRRARAAEEVSKDRLSEAEGESERLGHVPDLDRGLSGLEGMREGGDALEARASRLGAACGEGMEYRETSSRAFAAVQDGRGVLSGGRKAVEAGERAGRLRGLSGRMREAEAAAAVEVPDVAELTDAKARSEGLTDEAGDLGQLVDSVRARADDVAEGYNRAVDAKRELDEATEGLCPICGGELK